ncbi:MAG: bifunctional phosphoribosylaminoimidazolecarboxamide formyltransferase/IMP cyclohydrolase [Coxiellaceae bacterium]|nr:bifunctional phosphoribosylaminoimidazolecarboxamide formyltransferase/IMP cyclohydrolase [Coxiellaceae bacterium]
MVRYAKKSSSTTLTKIQRALISVSDKTNIVKFAQALQDLGVFILATGGTAKLLTESGVTVTEVSDVTRFPEIMGGRVKTLHPIIHGGLLGRRGQDDAVMTEHNIEPIDLLVCNLYPFTQVIQQDDCDYTKAIENIDIGGPTMLRSGAKNHQDVTVVIDPADYDSVLAQCQQQGGTDLNTRKRLSQKVFQRLADYNAAIAEYMSQQNDDSKKSEKNESVFVDNWQPQLHKQMDLRYGENPHQQAALYEFSPAQSGTLAQAKLLQGKPLSFNNLMDSEGALRCVCSLDPQQQACVIVKHATPCGVAQADTQLAAYKKAFACDSQSAFGGIIALNHCLQADTAKQIIANQFVEVILAPEVSAEALTCLQAKPNVRVMQYGKANDKQQYTYHTVSGGLLIQQADQLPLDASGLTVATQQQPTEQQLQDCLFAWKVVQYVKSNAIVFAKDGQTLGLGGGQTSRVFAAEIAVLKAQQADLSLQDSVVASDAFFPFADGIQVAVDAGVNAIIQPGGSIRDKEVIAAADKAGIVMLFTGHRHFRH